METIILIITALSLGLFILVNWDSLYARIFPTKWKTMSAFKEFMKEKSIWISNVKLYQPYYPLQAFPLDVSQGIAKKLSDTFSKWLVDFDIETDKSFIHIIILCEELKEKMRNIANPIRKPGGIDGDSLNNAIKEIPNILDQIEKALNK